MDLSQTLKYFCMLPLFSYGSFLQENNLLSNLAFENNEHSLRLEFSIPTSLEKRYLSTNLIYAQPNRIFKLPARLNLEIGVFFTPPPRQSLHTFAIIGISQDVVLPIYPSKFGNLFLGVGIGLYLKSQGDKRIGSAVTFGERFFLGYFFESFNIELYYKHYSNGTLQLPNSGYDFWGISFGYCF